MKRRSIEEDGTPTPPCHEGVARLPTLAKTRRRLIRKALQHERIAIPMRNSPMHIGAVPGEPIGISERVVASSPR